MKQIRLWVTKHRVVIFLLLPLVVIVAGVIYATQINLGPEVAPRQSSGAVITALTLGTPASAAESTRRDPKLRQADSYPTNEPIALRIETTANVETTVRLITSKGFVKELTPNSVSFTPPRSTFCCWTIDEPDTYTLQIFRPDGAITSLPLTIKPAPANARSIL